jgi:hypothetical protein
MVKLLCTAKSARTFHHDFNNVQDIWLKILLKVLKVLTLEELIFGKLFDHAENMFCDIIFVEEIATAFEKYFC